MTKVYTKVYIILESRFEWDDNKNLANIEKHGVSFVTACRILEGPVWTANDDRLDYGEVREISIGRMGPAIVLCVAHTARNGVTRIISARAASRRERKRFEDAERKDSS